MTTTKTLTGTEFRSGNHVAIVDFDGSRIDVSFGRRDPGINDEFRASAVCRSRSFKTITGATKAALNFLAERTANNAKPVGTLCADDIIR